MSLLATVFVATGAVAETVSGNDAISAMHRAAPRSPQHAGPQDRPQDGANAALVKTIDFVGLAEGMTVVTVGRGDSDLTRALAASLSNTGTLFLADVATDGTGGAIRASDEFSSRALQLSRKMADERSLFGKVVVVPFAPPVFADVRPPGGADLAVVDAPVANWRRSGTAHAAFKALHAALKPGARLILLSPSDGGHPGWLVQQAEAAGLRRAGEMEALADGRIGLGFVRPGA
ncbi:hypothetical protein [Chitinasiproducens palmae]|nr:hypothetical protein [Chitinasiproducens palmae]